MINPETLNIAGGVLLSLAGLSLFLISLSRIRNREFTLFNLGLFFFLYGVRWLSEVPDIAQAAGLFSPMGINYPHSVLTYLIPIPFAAFLFNVMGRGLFSSILLFFISTILYAAGAMIYDLFSTQGPLSPSIGTGVLAFWCMLAGINIILIREQNNPETTVLKFTLFFFLLSLAYDNLVVMNLLPWTFRLEHIDVLVLLTGMAFIAVRRERNRFFTAKSRSR